MCWSKTLIDRYKIVLFGKVTAHQSLPTWRLQIFKIFYGKSILEISTDGQDIKV